MLTAFQLDVNALEIFFTVCQELNLQTEAARVQLLHEMAKMGKIQRVWTTERSKEKFVKDLVKHYKVLNVTQKKASAHDDSGHA